MLDPDLFTFKPKLNEKSHQIAQNLSTSFHARQIKHLQRLKDLQEIAANDYRQWYCKMKTSKIPHHLPQIQLNEKSIDESNEIRTTNFAEQLNSKENEILSSSSLSLQKEIHPSNGFTTRLNRTNKTSLTLKNYTTPTATHSPPSTTPIPLVSSSFLLKRKVTQMSPPTRSKSPPKNVRQQADVSPKRTVTNDSINPERLKVARDEAERAMKEHKIFTIIGPYPALREALRKRGWVEKFYRGNSLPTVHNKKNDKKNNKSDDDEDDENDDDVGDDDVDEHPSYEDDGKVPPWEENDGYYGLLSRLVRTAYPNLIWSVRVNYDTNSLSKDQMVNHFARNGCFTTKTGLCNSLRNLAWFHSGSSEEFFPRCYKVSQEDDKVAFIDDYRLTACISLLKLVQNRCKGVAEPDMNSILAMSSDSPTDVRVPSTTNEEETPLTRSLTMLPGQLSTKPVQGKNQTAKKVPSSTIEFALNKVNHYTLSRDHDDIDMVVDTSIEPTDEQWTQFIEQFYLASHSNGDIEGMEQYLNRVDECLKNVQPHLLQYHIDGTRNIWILKPGAKSRGRGIVVYDRLEDILKLCSSNLTKDGKFVVQKYIERPLLIHNTKFDIRQWFLVTDWNPLTIWMFKDCYLRFCTEHFSLETRQSSVHLCNYSIQKNYKNNANRHIDLPAENMWTNSEFVEKYLRPMNLADRWDKLIYPGMKDAIICSMLVAQDSIDTRKNSFELFGADFMLGEDLKPWLIEINCSPTMARSTAVTTEMCDGVLEDTCKVMIDRKYNRSADTGRFELIHRGAPVPVPIYVGIDLRVEGKTCKTGRVLNNLTSSTNNLPNTTNTNTNNSQQPPPVMTPTSIPTADSPSSNGLAEVRQSQTHPSSAQNHSSNQKSQQNTTPSLKLRREMTQPVMSRAEFMSSDGTIEKIVEDELIPFPYRASLRINANPPPIDIRSKPSRTASNRLTADYFPPKTVGRPRINDRLPSPKDNWNKNPTASRINVLDFLFTGKSVKAYNHHPTFRPYHRNWVFVKSQSTNQNTSVHHLKPMRQEKSPPMPHNQTNMRIVAFSESTMTCAPNLDPECENTTASTTTLTVA